VLLKGDGHGGFTALSTAQSGLAVVGESHAAAAFSLGAAKQTALVVTRCEGPVLLFVPLVQ
jgi:enediyne biosynthesis protein E4